MTDLKCPHCGGTTFALSDEQLEHATYPLSVVQCRTAGSRQKP